jgi:hypothetical protein
MSNVEKTVNVVGSHADYLEELASGLIFGIQDDAEPGHLRYVVSDLLGNRNLTLKDKLAVVRRCHQITSSPEAWKAWQESRAKLDEYLRAIDTGDGTVVQLPPPRKQFQ